MDANVNESVNEYGVAEPSARGWYWVRDRHVAWGVLHRSSDVLCTPSPETGERYCWSVIGNESMLSWREVGAVEVVGPIPEPAPQPQQIGICPAAGLPVAAHLILPGAKECVKCGRSFS